MNSVINITIIFCFGICFVMTSDVEKEDIKTKPSVNLSKKELCKYYVILIQALHFVHLKLNYTP